MVWVHGEFMCKACKRDFSILFRAVSQGCFLLILSFVGARVNKQAPASVASVCQARHYLYRNVILCVYLFGLNSKVKLCHFTSCCISVPGENCEVSSRSGRCVSGVCKNGGRCVDLLVGGFMCQCPEGEFEKPYCQMSTRSFPGNAFVTFRGLRQRFHFTLSFM